MTMFQVFGEVLESSEKEVEVSGRETQCRHFCQPGIGRLVCGDPGAGWLQASGGASKLVKRGVRSAFPQRLVIRSLLVISSSCSPVLCLLTPTVLQERCRFFQESFSTLRSVLTSDLAGSIPCRHCLLAALLSRPRLPDGGRDCILHGAWHLFG